jgi:phosphoribosylformylglycinamidine cyclo-ligase
VDAYGRAGVDLDAAARAVELIREVAAGASRPEVVEGVGGFAGLFRLDDRRLLAAATDGVGTKLEVARLAGRLDTVGIDLVAMCADDVACTGAEPLFFLDYVVTGDLVPSDVAALVEGIAEGCRRAGCALLGGETAEHPGHLEPGAFDLAGFCVGLVEEERLLAADRVREGDAVVGLPSSGVHANGFSLIRRVLRDAGVSVEDRPRDLGRSVAEELLEPTEIYAPRLLAASREGLVRAAAHVTGGGIGENLARALPPNLGADLDRSTWTEPPVFAWLASLGGITEPDMMRTFNMGVGMLAVVPGDRAADATAVLGPGATVVGRVTDRPGVRL